MGFRVSLQTGGDCEYLKFQNLWIYKKGLLDGFDDKDLYAEVEGRVDTIDGRYLGFAQVALSGQSDLDFTQANDDKRQTAISARKKLSPAKAKSKKKQQITKAGKY